MDTLTEIKAAAGALSPEQKKSLVQFLLAPSTETKPADELSTERLPAGHSILDIRPVSLGVMLSAMTPDDDLLGEMLEGRR